MAAKRAIARKDIVLKLTSIAAELASSGFYQEAALLTQAALMIGADRAGVAYEAILPAVEAHLESLGCVRRGGGRYSPPPKD